MSSPTPAASRPLRTASSNLLVGDDGVTRYQTKGDNPDNSNDPWLVEREDIRGMYGMAFLIVQPVWQIRGEAYDDAKSDVSQTACRSLKRISCRRPDVTSSEMYRYPDGREEAVLRDITLDIKLGECWGVIGDEAFELELLMQIIANVRPYGSGRCSLVERGMMRRKRRILSHVFYISGGDTVPGNLNTLEYLMYVTASSKVPDRKRQASILEALLASGPVLSDARTHEVSKRRGAGGGLPAFGGDEQGAAGGFLGGGAHASSRVWRRESATSWI